MPPGYRETKDKDNSDEIRIWAVLDKIDKRLSFIEKSALNVVRLDERVNNQNEILNRHGIAIEEHSNRIRQSELNLTEYKTNGGHVSGTVTDVKKELSNIYNELNSLKASNKANSAIRKIVSAIIFWIGGIISAYILFKINAS